MNSQLETTGLRKIKDDFINSITFKNKNFIYRWCQQLYRKFLKYQFKKSYKIKTFDEISLKSHTDEVFKSLGLKGLTIVRYNVYKKDTKVYGGWKELSIGDHFKNPEISKLNDYAYNFNRLCDVMHNQELSSDEKNKIYEIFDSSLKSFNVLIPSWVEDNEILDFFNIRILNEILKNEKEINFYKKYIIDEKYNIKICIDPQIIKNKNAYKTGAYNMFTDNYFCKLDCIKEYKTKHTFKSKLYWLIINWKTILFILSILLLGFFIYVFPYIEIIQTVYEFVKNIFIR